MAVLAEGVQYGLSSHGFSSENKSLVFVKLTDSALKSIEEYLRTKLKTSQHPSIQFLGNEGRLWFPSGEEGRGSAFSFNLSSAAEIGGPQGSFECVQQCGSRSLESLGPMALKMNIRAKDDVYEATRQRMAVAEEESKKNCTRVIKQASGPDIGRKVKVRKHAGSVVIPPRKDKDSPPPYSSSRGGSNHLSSLHPSSVHHNNAYNSSLNSRNSTSSPSLNVGRPMSNAISPLPRSAASPSYPATTAPPVSYNNAPSKEGYTTTTTTTTSSTTVEGNPELMRRPLRERIIHLLAIRPYKKPELISRIYKEGVKDKDKKLITPVLVAVGLMKDQAYHLARHVWNDVHDDWPFYTEQERQILKRRKPQNLTPPGSDSSSGSGHSPPSSTSQPSGSPSGSSATMKSSSNPSGSLKRTSPQESPVSGSVDLVAATAAKKQRISYYKKPDSSQTQSVPDSRNSKPVITPKSSLQVRPSPPNTTQSVDRPENYNYYRSNPSPVVVSTRVTSSTDGPETPNSSPDSLTENMETETDCEFVHKYQRIISGEQRSRYKADFNSQYSEYRDLHKAIDKVSKRFAQLEEELRQEHEGTAAWQRIKSQIVREYKENIRDVKYQETKRRFQYLHEKLAHIKRLVLEWDTAQAQLCRT